LVEVPCIAFLHRKETDAVSIETLVTALVDAKGGKRTEWKARVAAVFNSVLDSTIKDGACKTPVGTFKAAKRNARKGVTNFGHAATYEVPERWTISFKPNAGAKARINEELKGGEAA
jgi:nucleoid DNA-binding protein